MTTTDGTRPGMRYRGASLALLASLVLLAACGGEESETRTEPASAPTADGDGRTVTLFADDFADNSSRWPTKAAVPGVTVAVRDGFYRWDFQQEEQDAQIMFPDAIEDLQEGVLEQIRLEADVRFTSPGSVGLICHGSLADETEYGFTVHPYGRATIVKRFGESAAEGKKDSVRLAEAGPLPGTSTAAP